MSTGTPTPNLGMNTWVGTDKVLRTEFNTNFGDIDTEFGLSGTTASRPTAGLYVGRKYFDTTLGYIVTWNGSAWQNALVPSSSVGAASGVAPLNASTQIDPTYLASLLATANTWTVNQTFQSQQSGASSNSPSLGLFGWDGTTKTGASLQADGGSVFGITGGWGSINAAATAWNFKVADDGTIVGGYGKALQAVSGGYKVQSAQTSVIVATAGVGVSQSVTFPTAFSATPDILPVVYALSGGSAGYVSAQALNATANGFTLAVNSYIAQTVYVVWFAVGT